MRALGWIIAAVALVIVAIGAYVVLNSGALLERAIETYGSRYLGVPVDVGNVNVSLKQGSATIDQLVVGNPPGFPGPPAISVNKIGVTLNTSRISSQLIALKDVTIDGASVAAVIEGTESNLQKLMDNLQTRIAASQRAEETGVQSEVKLIIDRFDFTNAHATANSNLLGETSVDIPDIHLTDIGKKSNGATVGEVLEQVLRPVIRAVMQGMARKGVDLGGARERLESNVREKADKAIQGGLERLKNAIQPEQNEKSQQQPQDQP